MHQLFQGIRQNHPELRYFLNSGVELGIQFAIRMEKLKWINTSKFMISYWIANTAIMPESAIPPFPSRSKNL